MEYYLIMKRNESAWMNYDEYKKAISKGYIQCDSIYITFLKLQYYRDREQIGGCQELRRKWVRDGNGYAY